MNIPLTTTVFALLLAASSAMARQTAVAVPQGLTHTIADATSGTAAWYGGKFAGRKTASGQRFNPQALTAAHATYPFGSRVRVTNLKNKRNVVVTINDRLNPNAGRVIDLSRSAAQRLGYVKSGLTQVRVERVGGRGTRRR